MKLPALRPYQLAPVAAVVAMARELGSALLCSATGSGKTCMGLHAAHQLAEGGVVLWLAPSLGLIEQTADRVRDAGVEPRILQAGDTGPRDAPVIVASVPSLLAMFRRGEDLPACSVVVHDEARGHLAPQWREVARGVAARYRLGLDATPCRADGVALGDLFAGLVQGPPVSERSGVMLYEDRLYGFAVAAMGCVCWGEPGAAEQAVDVAEAMEAQFTARLKSRRDAAKQAAKRTREDAARAAATPSGPPPCIHCPHGVLSHAVDGEERRGCGEPFCGCRQYECAAVQP